MAVFEPPPTHSDPFIKTPESDVPKFNPIWLGWFIKLVKWINSNGGGGGVIDHNSLAGLQGGTTAEYYHLTAARYSTLTGVQNPNLVLAGPTSGGSAISTFRALVNADFPTIGTAGTYTKITFNAQGLETAGTSAVLASADYANQGTTTTVLHGNAAGNPAWGSVVLGDLDNALSYTSYNAWIGNFIEDTSATVASAGGVVTLTFQKLGGGNVTAIFNGGAVTVVCPLTIALTAGTDTAPTLNYVYIRQATPTVLTVSTTGFPTAEEFVSVAEVVVQTAATIATYGTYNTTAYTNHLWGGAAENGTFVHIRDWIRAQPATWVSGTLLTPTLTVLGPDTLTIAVATGTVRQIHPKTFPAFNSATAGSTNLTTFFVVNHPTAYTPGKDLFNFKLTSGNTAAGNNDIISWVIWGVISTSSGDCKVFINLPSGFYRTSASAIDDASGYSNYSIPSAYVGEGFLIAKLSYQYSTGGGGHLTLVENKDLRGLQPSTMAGGTGGSVSSFLDSAFSVQNAADTTKQLQVALAGSTTGAVTTFTISSTVARAITFPDATGTLLYSGGALGTPSSGTLTNATGLPVGGISATGTPGATTYLRGDGTWSTPAGSDASIAARVALRT